MRRTCIFTIPSSVGRVTFELPAPKSMREFETMLGAWLRHFPPTAEQVTAANALNAEHDLRVAVKELKALRATK